jgi:hypothetical protein
VTTVEESFRQQKQHVGVVQCANELKQKVFAQQTEGCTMDMQTAPCNRVMNDKWMALETCSIFCPSCPCTVLLIGGRLANAAVLMMKRSKRKLAHLLNVQLNEQIKRSPDKGSLRHMLGKLSKREKFMQSFLI